MRNLLFSFLAFIILTSVSNAQVLDKKIEIDSDELKYYSEENKAIFKGNVIAIHGDIKITTLECVVTFEKKSEDPNSTEKNNVKSIELKGSIIIETPKETIESNYGIYDMKSGVITLSGDVKLFQSNNTLVGDKLIHNVKTGESVLSSNGNNRVKAFIIPESKK